MGSGLGFGLEWVQFGAALACCRLLSCVCIAFGWLFLGGMRTFRLTPFRNLPLLQLKIGLESKMSFQLLKPYLMVATGGRGET